MIARKLWILMTAISKRTQGELPQERNLASLRKQWMVSRVPDLLSHVSISVLLSM
jgi:hypothetical protein